MPWSKWYPFNEKSIKSNAPQNEGIYRIKLKNYCFGFINNKWRGLFEINPSLNKLLKINEPIRISECEIKLANMPSIEQTICTDLIYIGKSENIQNRLLQHLRGPDYNGNKCIYKLLNQGYLLEFSYLQRRNKDYNQAEKNFFKKFIDATGGFCLPCDCCSNECKSEGGKCIPTYIGIGATPIC